MCACVCICAENGFCSCLTDKIEEAQKELKDPKAAQKGKSYLTRKYVFYLFYLHGSLFVFSFTTGQLRIN